MAITNQINTEWAVYTDGTEVPRINLIQSQRKTDKIRLFPVTVLKVHLIELNAHAAGITAEDLTVDLYSRLILR